MKLKAYCQLHGIGPTKLADRVGISRQEASRILKGTRKASAAIARQIERGTRGAVTRYELRPDIFGRKPRNGAAQGTMPASVANMATDCQPEQRENDHGTP